MIMVTGMYSYETYASRKSKDSGNQPKRRADVGYFKLVDDGDEAIIRFDYDNANEIVMAHVHDEPVGKNKHRRVLCLRENARDDMGKCPLCARGDKYFAKVYLKMIEYVKDEQGKVVPHAVIWERPEPFAEQIVEYINNYGGLKDIVFKVKRKGIRGAKDTEYFLTPMPSTVYNEGNGYVKDFSEFEHFYFYPHSFLSKTKEEIEEYIRTGDFPFPNYKADSDAKKEDGHHAASQSANQNASFGGNGTEPSAPSSAPSQSDSAPKQQEAQPQQDAVRAQTKAPDASDPFVARPRRRYDIPLGN